MNLLAKIAWCHEFKKAVFKYFKDWSDEDKQQIFESEIDGWMEYESWKDYQPEDALFESLSCWAD